MMRQLESARSVTYRAAESVENGHAPDCLQTSIVKLQASETVENVTSEALQIHGANGYQKGHPLEYLYRLARGRRIATGADEIIKNNIADVSLNNSVLML